MYKHLPESATDSNFSHQLELKNEKCFHHDRSLECAQKADVLATAEHFVFAVFHL